MDPRVRERVLAMQPQPFAPSSFDIAPSASTAPTAALLEKQIAGMPPSPPIEESPFRIESPYEMGSFDDFRFRRDTGRLVPAKQEVMPVTVPDPDIPGKKVKKPAVSEPQTDITGRKEDPAGLDTPETKESPMQKAYGEYEAMLKSRAEQLASDMESEDRKKWPQLIAMALAGYGDALVATAGGQSDFLKQSMEARSAKQERLENRRQKLESEQSQIPLLKAQAEESAYKEAAAARKEAQSQRRHEEEMGLKEREFSLQIEKFGIEKEKEKRKVEAEEKTAEEARKTALKAGTNALTVIDKALDQVGPMSAGAGGAANAWLPGGPYRNLASQLKTVRSELAFGRLTQMRNASKTGGALGQVSNIELDLLESSLAALDQMQSPEQLKQNLLRVRQHYTNSLNALQRIEDQGGDMPIGEGGPNVPRGTPQGDPANLFSGQTTESNPLGLGGF